VTTTQPTPWFDDLVVGQHFRSTQPIRLTAEDIVEFARRYDPNPGHLDERAAQDTVFAGLSASGWQTAAVTQRLLADVGAPIDHSVGLGVELRWPTPTRPGDELVVDLAVTAKRLSRGRPGWGVVEIAYTTANQRGEVRQEAKMTILVSREPGRVDAGAASG